MSTVLITGANRGLGLEFARQYAAEGHSVIATCRDPDTAPAGLRETGADIRALDIGAQASVDALAEGLAGRPIDLLVNNAGIYGPSKAGQGLDVVEAEAWLETLRVNTIGPFLLTRALVPNLERADEPTVAIVSSKMGSIEDNTSGGTYIYRSSKTALNQVATSLTLDLAPRGIKVALLHPGWVRTDMGGPQGLIDTTESVSGMRRVIASTTAETSGRFFAFDGKEIPW